MVAPAVAAAGISAAGNVLGGLLGRKSSGKDAMILQYGLNKQAFMDQKAHEDFWNTQQLQFAQQQFARQVQRDTHGIRERVVDAKAAGLHPLFALGANVSSGPSIGFSSPTGSAAGVGLATGSDSRTRSLLGSVGRDIGSIILAAEQARQQEKENERQATMDRARLRVLSADASRSEAEAALAHSRVKREEQRSNQTRPPAESFGTGPDTGPQVRYEANPRGRTGERPLHIGDQRWSVGKGSRVEDWEQEYGDVAASLYGLGKISWDAARNTYQALKRASARERKAVIRRLKAAEKRSR